MELLVLVKIPFSQLSVAEHLQVYYLDFPFLSFVYIYYTSPNKSFIRLYLKLGLI